MSLHAFPYRCRWTCPPSMRAPPRDVRHDRNDHDVSGPYTLNNCSLKRENFRKFSQPNRKPGKNFQKKQKIIKKICYNHFENVLFFSWFSIVIIIIMKLFSCSTRRKKKIDRKLARKR